MKRSFLNKTALLAAFTILLSCKSKKEALPSASVAPAIPKVAKTASSRELVIQKISNAQFNFKTLSIKAKAELDLGNNSNNVSMNIRIRKDEAIWVSITAIAGIEVARALITPDSIKVLNRLQSLYLQKPFSYINRYANRSLNFSALQSLLTGNAFPGTLTTSSTIEGLNNQSRISGSTAEIAYSLLFNQENKLIQNNIKDRQTEKELKAAYSNFGEVSGTKLPMTVNLNSNAGRKAVNIELKYSSASVNEPVEMPFNVPKKFSQAE